MPTTPFTWLWSAVTRRRSYTSTIVHPNHDPALTRRTQTGPTVDGVPEPRDVWAEQTGREAGLAGVPRADATGPQAPAVRHVVHAAAVDAHLTAARGESQLADLEVTIETAAPQAKRLRRRAQQLRAGAKRVRREHVQPLRQRRHELRRQHHERKQDYERLPFYLRGVVVKRWWVALLIATSAGLVDVGVLHAAFDATPMSSTSVWINAIAIPMALIIATIPVGMGLGLGARALRSHPARLRALGVAVLLPVLGVVAGLILLTIFRDAAVDTANQGFRELVDGNEEASLELVLKTTFLGPLSWAAFCAGALAEGLYVLGKEGREIQDELRRLDAEIATIEVQARHHEQEIETAHRDADQAELDADDAHVRAASAAATKHFVAPRVDAEKAAHKTRGEAVAARYETEYQLAAQQGRNGKIALAAAATIDVPGGTLTPAPFHAEGDPVLPPLTMTPSDFRARRSRPDDAPPSNGHRPATTEI